MSKLGIFLPIFLVVANLTVSLDISFKVEIIVEGLIDFLSVAMVAIDVFVASVVDTI